MTLREIFVNHHAELRVGWRLVSFAVLASLCASIVGVFARSVGLRDDLVLNSLFLAAILLVTVLVTRFINRKPLGAIGLSLHQGAVRELGIGCLIGFLMMTGIFLIELMSGYIGLSWRGYGIIESAEKVLVSIPYFGVAACLEEVLFRGYFFQTLIQWTTFLPATLLMSVFFALGHLLNPHATTFGLINVALAGIFFSVAYMKTRSLWLPFGVHFSWNFSQTALFAFPTSGIAFGRFRLFDLSQGGPDWVTGGPFGPEGGMLATLALVIATWYVLKSTDIRTPEGIVTLDSVEDLLPAPGAEGSPAA